MLFRIVATLGSISVTLSEWGFADYRLTGRSRLQRTKRNNPKHRHKRKKQRHNIGIRQPDRKKDRQTDRQTERERKGDGETDGETVLFSYHFEVGGRWVNFTSGTFRPSATKRRCVSCWRNRPSTSVPSSSKEAAMPLSIAPNKPPSIAPSSNSTVIFFYYYYSCHYYHYHCWCVVVCALHYPPPPASHFIIVVVVIGRPICGWKLRFDGLTVAGGDGPFLSSAPSSAGRRGRLEGLSDLKRQCNSSSTFNHFPSPDSPISGADEGQALIPASIRPRAMPPRAIPIGFVSIPSNLPRARVCVCLIIIRSSAYFYDARSINKMMAVALACACCRDTDVARLDNASIEARSAPSP